MGIASFRQVEVERFLRAAKRAGARSVEVDLRSLTLSMQFPAGDNIDNLSNPARNSGADDGVRYGQENWDED